MERFPNIVCLRHETKEMACFCPECVEPLCSECSYHHTLHSKHRPVPNVFIKFVPAFLLAKVNRCTIHNSQSEFKVANHGNPCCKKYTQTVHRFCGSTSGSGNVRSVGLIGKHIFKVNAGNITGCAILPDGQMVFVDNKYDCLLVFENNGSFNRTISLLSKPYCVAALSTNQIAVTQDKEVIIINLETDLTEKWIDIGFSCLGINFNERKLIVTLADGNGICLLNEDGKMFSRINVQGVGASDASIMKDSLYFTASHEHQVFCCDLEGTVSWNFQRKGLKGPNQLTLDRNGYVYVVYETSLKTVVLLPDGKCHKILLCEQDGLHLPKTIRICNTSNELLLCNSTSCTALVYNIRTCNYVQKVISVRFSFLSMMMLLFLICAVFLAIIYQQAIK